MALTVCTNVVFSLTLAVAGEVNTGLLSLTGVTVTLISCARRVAGVVVGGDFDFVDVVAVEVGRGFEVRRGEEGQIAGRAVDREQAASLPPLIEYVDRLSRQVGVGGGDRLTAVVFSATLAVAGEVNDRAVVVDRRRP